jgi:copper chaperone
MEGAMCNQHETSSTHSETTTVADGRAFAVKGMTCEHCAASVTEEVEQVAGVTGVDVDIAHGRVTVRGEGFSDEAIHDAVDEAGYEVVTA